MYVCMCVHGDVHVHAHVLVEVLCMHKYESLPETCMYHVHIPIHMHIRILQAKTIRGAPVARTASHPKDPGKSP